MKPDKKTLVPPILMITVGAGWLLTTLGIEPEIDWIWTLTLAVAGVMTFAVGGLDKVTMVVGPFFIVASCLSVLRQTDRLQPNVEVPVIVIVAGLLLLIARSPAVPMPSWILDDAQGSKPPADSDRK
ncbi:MAG: hypothetical protein WD845_15405 [Pirellulales bacterium]